MNRDQVMSRRAIESMIAEGHTIVIFEGKVLRLDGWMEKHPGGQLPLRHMVGRDATDEINVYHSLTTQKMMGAYRIGKISGPWTNFTPPIRGGTFRKEVVEDSESDVSSDTDNDHPSSLPDSDLAVLSTQNSSRTSLDSDSNSATGLAEKLELISGGKPEQNALPNDVLNGIRRRQAVGAANLGKTPESNAPLTVSKCENLSQSRIDWSSECMQKEIDKCIDENPSLDAATQREITKKYQALHERVKNEGYYDCRYSEYAKEMVRYTALFALMLVALKAEWYMTSAVFLGLFWHQIMFTAHDAGHRGITHNFIADTLVGIFIADFCCGLSIGWWKSSHNVHHLVTNSPEHDPDIQNVPLFAICPSMFKNTHSSYYKDFVFYWDAAADFMIPYQRYTYYPIMSVARFNLYVLSWIHLLSPRSQNLGSATWTRYAEITGMIVFWYVFGYQLLYRSIPTLGLRVAFVFVSHIATFPLHVQITLSHWAMPTADLGDAESFPQRQLRTTMDVDCPPWLDFVHGGLQFQAIHHLFPRVPRHNLRSLQPMVKQFCKDTNIEYKIHGFTEGNQIVLSRLDEISKQVDTLIKCQKYMIETGESGLH